MTTTPTSRQATEQVFVEIIGADGLAHHVGPFETTARAEEWIEQNSTAKVRPPGTANQKITVANGGHVLLRPCD
jgi:hypothetical protein